MDKKTRENWGMSELVSNVDGVALTVALGNFSLRQDGLGSTSRSAKFGRDQGQGNSLNR